METQHYTPCVCFCHGSSPAFKKNPYSPKQTNSCLSPIKGTQIPLSAYLLLSTVSTDLTHWSVWLAKIWANWQGLITSKSHTTGSWGCSTQQPILWLHSRAEWKLELFMLNFFLSCNQWGTSRITINQRSFCVLSLGSGWAVFHEHVTPCISLVHECTAYVGNSQGLHPWHDKCCHSGTPHSADR